ncbi:hypothetical protein [Methylorubrum aminovorans]
MTQPNRRDFVLLVQAASILGPDLADAVADSSAHALTGARCPATGPALVRDNSCAAGERAAQTGQVR